MKKIIFGVLGFLIVMIGVYFFFFEQEEKEEFVFVNVQDSVVQKLYEMANPSDDVVTMGDIYLKESFSNEFILGSAFVFYLKEHPDATNISEEEINLAVRNIFGEITYAHDSGYIVSNYLCAFKYDKNTHSYTYLKGCDGSLDTKMIRKVVEAKKSDTEYIIREKMIVVVREEQEEENTQVSLKVYNNLNKNKLLDTITYQQSVEKEPTILLEDYIDSASTYEYHFVFDGASFVYKSIKKVG